MPSPPDLAGTAVIYDGTGFGAGCSVQDCAVVGKPPVLGARSTAAAGDGEPAVLGDRVAVCSHAVVCASAQIGDDCVVGDGALVRERVKLGRGCVVGAHVVIENDVSIGSGVKLQTGAYITAHCTIEDDVFVAPGVITTNDNSMGRHAPGAGVSGVTLRRACRIGAGAVLLPGIEVGEEAFVAAGAVVTRDVDPFTLVMGSPARLIRRIESAEEIENWR